MLPLGTAEITQARFHSFAPEIVVSNSSGQIYILSGADLSQVTEQWDAHGFEPWIAAWDCWSNHVIYTGQSAITKWQ